MSTENRTSALARGGEKFRKFATSICYKLDSGELRPWELCQGKEGLTSSFRGCYIDYQHRRYQWSVNNAKFVAWEEEESAPDPDCLLCKSDTCARHFPWKTRIVRAAPAVAGSTAADRSHLPPNDEATGCRAGTSHNHVKRDPAYAKGPRAGQPSYVRHYPTVLSRPEPGSRAALALEQAQEAVANVGLGVGFNASLNVEPSLGPDGDESAYGQPSFVVKLEHKAVVLSARERDNAQKRPKLSKAALTAPLLKETATGQFEGFEPDAITKAIKYVFEEKSFSLRVAVNLSLVFEPNKDRGVFEYASLVDQGLIPYTYGYAPDRQKGNKLDQIRLDLSAALEHQSTSKPVGPRQEGVWLYRIANDTGDCLSNLCREENTFVCICSSAIDCRESEKAGCVPIQVKPSRYLEGWQRYEYQCPFLAAKLGQFKAFESFALAANFVRNQVQAQKLFTFVNELLRFLSLDCTFRHIGTRDVALIVWETDFYEAAVKAQAEICNIEITDVAQDLTEIIAFNKLQTEIVDLVKEEVKEEVDDRWIEWTESQGPWTSDARVVATRQPPTRAKVAASPGAPSRKVPAPTAQVGLNNTEFAINLSQKRQYPTVDRSDSRDPRLKSSASSAYPRPDLKNNIVYKPASEIQQVHSASPKGRSRSRSPLPPWRKAKQETSEDTQRTLSEPRKRFVFRPRAKEAVPPPGLRRQDILQRPRVQPETVAPPKARSDIFVPAARSEGSRVTLVGRSSLPQSAKAGWIPKVAAVPACPPQLGSVALDIPNASVRGSVGLLAKAPKPPPYDSFTLQKPSGVLQVPPKAITGVESSGALRFGPIASETVKKEKEEPAREGSH